MRLHRSIIYGQNFSDIEDETEREKAKENARKLAPIRKQIQIAEARAEPLPWNTRKLIPEMIPLDWTGILRKYNSENIPIDLSVLKTALEPYRNSDITVKNLSESWCPLEYFRTLTGRSDLDSNGSEIENGTNEGNYTYGDKLHDIKSCDTSTTASVMSEFTQSLSFTNDNDLKRKRNTINMRDNSYSSIYREGGTFSYTFISPKNHNIDDHKWTNIKQNLPYVKIYHNRSTLNDKQGFIKKCYKKPFDKRYMLTLDKRWLWLIMTHTRWKVKGMRILLHKNLQGSLQKGFSKPNTEIVGL